MQRWKERAKANFKGSPGDLRDSPRDANSVQRFQPQRFQDQQVQRSTQKIGFLFTHSPSLFTLRSHFSAIRHQ